MPYALNDGVRIHYEVTGSGPVVVFMHGIGSDSTAWKDNGAVDWFSDSHTVVTMDARGLGRSDRPGAPADYHRDRRRDDGFAVLDAIEADRVHLVGYSLGGSNAIYMATKQPSRVASVVAIAANPYPMRVNLAITDTERRSAPRPPKHVRALLRLRRIVLNRLSRGRELSVPELVRAANTTDFDVDAAIESMTMPTYLIAGEHDHQFAIELTRSFAHDLADGRLELVPGEDHGMQARLRPVFPKIEAFIAEVDARAS